MLACWLFDHRRCDLQWKWLKVQTRGTSHCDLQHRISLNRWTILIFEYFFTICPALSDKSLLKLQARCVGVQRNCEMAFVDGRPVDLKSWRVGQVSPTHFFSFLNFKHVVEAPTIWLWTESMSINTESLHFECSTNYSLVYWANVNVFTSVDLITLELLECNWCNELPLTHTLLLKHVLTISVCNVSRDAC